MTGILERIEAKLDQLLGAGAQANMQQGVGQPLQAQQPQAGLGLGALGGAAAPVGYPPATAEMITALITPHVQNPAIHAALKEQMGQMGIASLPDAQPGQYAELHARFQSVINQAQAAAAAQPAATPASII
jgi:hypothetical protein